YISKRVLRLTASPHSVAAGVAAGVFVSCTPFLGFHMIMAAVIAYAIGGNIVASAIGTTFANPLTLPFIWAGTLEAGRLLLYGSLGGEHLHVAKILGELEFSELWGPLLKPMAVGSVPFGLVFAAIFYVLTRYATAAFRRQRRR